MTDFGNSHKGETNMKRALLFVAIVSTLIASYSLLVRASLPQVPSNAWSATGDMALGRAGASAVLLPDGRVLVAGGTNEGGVTASVERYSPTAGGFLATPSMESARANHTATMLEDGRVLVVGGIGTDGHAMVSAELYDPSANAWTAAAPLYHARSGHSATLLWDGRVLVAGGDDTGMADATLEVFDPISSTFSAVDAVLSAARTGHAAASLADGRVLIVGGFDGTSALASVDVYDPRTNTVSAGPSLAIARAGHSATTLLDGRVLIAGGASDSSELASGEIFDPSTESFTIAGNTMSVARQRHVAFLLPHNNNVLIVGGTAGGNAVAAAELFTPWEGTGGTFCATAVCESGFAGPSAPNAARAWAAGAALSFPADHTIRTGPADGLLVLAGGSATAAASNPLSSAELYGFATVKTDKADYAPGNTVAIAGSGWVPGESVTLLLHEWPEFDEHSLVDVTADENGDIVSTEFVPDAHDIGVRFYLTAFGQVSQAQTTFTDAGVNVTPATGGTNISADKAANATSPQFTQLGDIVLAESAVGDFVIQSNRTFVLTAPSGWEFNPGVGSTSTTKSGPGGNELTANSIAISATTITVNLTVTGTAQTNTLSIKNLEVRATNGANIPASGNILRTVGTPGTAIINGVTNDVTNFGSLSQTAGVVRKLVVTLPNQTFTDGSTIVGSGNSGTPSNQTAGVAFNISRLTATDQFFNVVTTYSGAKTISYSGPTGSPSFTTAVIFASGQATTALATTLTKAETTTITASDGATSGPASSSLTVNAGPLSTFSVTATDGSNIGTQTAGTPFNIKVTALDAGGNTVTTFDSGGNKVSITSTGTLSAGSGNTSAFINGVLASHSVTFSNSGNFTITATRNAGGSESGTSNTFTVNPPACTAPSVTTQPTNQTITYGQNATFTAAASGSPTPTVQWQLNSGLGFTNMSGATSTTLTLTQPAASANGNQYRAVFTNSCTPPTATSNAATLTVNKATVTPSVTASNKVYDGTTSATIASRSLDGVIGADDVALTGGTATFNTPNVGTGKTVTAVGLTLSGTTAGNYQLSSPTAMTTANITAVNLTVSAAAGVSRPYDGTTVAVLDFSSASLVGVIAPDVVTIDHASAVGAFADKNVGTNKPVSVTGVALTGAAAGNYTVSQPTGLTANITAKNLTVSAAAAASRPYDGTTMAVLDFSSASLVGVIAPDVVTIDHASAVGAFADKNIGTNKPVTVTGVGLSGPGAGNYTVSRPSGLTASITAVNLTATIAASDKDYDATATATITNCSLAGVVGSEVVSCTTSNAHFASANASSSPQTVTSDVALAGADAGNYTLTTPATTSAKINAKAASVTPNAASKTYGTADPGFSGTLSGFVAADGVNAVYSRTAGETVAGSPYTISTVLSPAAVLENYTVAYNTANFTITARALTVTAAGTSRVYDGTTSATVTLSDDRVAGDVLHIGYTSASFTNKNVGTAKTVSVTGISVTGEAAANYTFNTTASASADISARLITVTAVASSKIYDGTTASSGVPAISSGTLASGDTVSFTQTYDNKNVGTAKTLTPAGVVSDGNGGNNYAVTLAINTAGIITARSLTVTASGIDKVYDGTTTATVTVSDNRIAGDVFTAIYSSASFSNKNVGANKTVTVSGVAISGAEAGNYALSSTTASTTASITARPLTVTAVTDSKIYDGTVASNKVPLISGGTSLAGGDTAALVEAFDTPQVGTGKTLKPTALVNDGYGGNNYAVTLVNDVTGVIGAWSLKGFYQPVAMSSGAIVYNTIKGGSTVPLKFNIYAGMGGAEQTTTSAVQSFVLQLISCTPGIDDPVDESFTTTGGTALRYDSTAGQFIQNWQSPKVAGKCYAVTMTAQDSSTVTAYFKTK